MFALPAYNDRTFPRAGVWRDELGRQYVPFDTEEAEAFTGADLAAGVVPFHVRTVHAGSRGIPELAEGDTVGLVGVAAVAAVATTTTTTPVTAAATTTPTIDWRRSIARFAKERSGGDADREATLVRYLEGAFPPPPPQPSVTATPPRRPGPRSVSTGAPPTLTLPFTVVSVYKARNRQELREVFGPDGPQFTPDGSAATSAAGKYEGKTHCSTNVGIVLLAMRYPNWEDLATVMGLEGVLGMRVVREM